MRPNKMSIDPAVGNKECKEGHSQKLDLLVEQKDNSVELYGLVIFQLIHNQHNHLSEHKILPHRILDH